MTDAHPLLIILGIVAVIVGGIAFGYWLLITTEGVYLGRKVVIWLYDVYATRYDGIKKYQRHHEQQFLVQPLLDILDPMRDPLILDVATGTARFPLALVSNPGFQGRVIGVDLSRKMLSVAAGKLKGETRTDLICAPAETLPFPSETFDVVACLEALEFMTRREPVLEELLRVLRPGGLLLISNRINAPEMIGKTYSSEGLAEALGELGILEVYIDDWQVDYELAWATKDGESEATLARDLDEVLLCPSCLQAIMKSEGKLWRCPNCQHIVNVGTGGVVEVITANAGD